TTRSSCAISWYSVRATALTMVRLVVPDVSAGESRCMAVTFSAWAVISGSRRQFGPHQFPLIPQVPRHVGIDVVEHPVGRRLAGCPCLFRGVGQRRARLFVQHLVAGLVPQVAAFQITPEP